MHHRNQIIVLMHLHENNVGVSMPAGIEPLTVQIMLKRKLIMPHANYHREGQPDKYYMLTEKGKVVYTQLLATFGAFEDYEVISTKNQAARPNGKTS